MLDLLCCENTLGRNLTWSIVVLQVFNAHMLSNATKAVEFNRFFNIMSFAQGYFENEIKGFAPIM